ncbi:TetR/AcrR family transcriptional regulator [Segetibacter koreensis]|uniref:TetR/AcrR family transcriptional regulator n=1 Tax=Segetibacter koreensis TaxID=398037 RepID=UPI00037081AC|nr:TetR/AcrR family transcriptional regulator [Segetibacter koreensis]
MISQSKIQDKRKEIWDAALKLFVEYGFHGTPTSKIAAEAGVANGTLFHYYKTKEDLVIVLYNDIKNELNSYITSKVSCNESLETKVKIMFINSLYWALDNREKFYYIHQFHFSPHFAKISPETIHQQSTCHIRLIEEGIKAELLKPLPIEFLLTIVSSHVFGVYQYLTSEDFSESQQKKVINDAFGMLWDMIAP